MWRKSLPVLIVLFSAGAVAGSGAQSPAPHSSRTPKMTRVPGFSNKVHVPRAGSATLSAADCGRRATVASASSGSMGPDGPSRSQTLVAVPLGGGNTSTATQRAQIAEACSHQRH